MKMKTNKKREKIIGAVLILLVIILTYLIVSNLGDIKVKEKSDKQYEDYVENCLKGWQIIKPESGEEGTAYLSLDYCIRLSEEELKDLEYNFTDKFYASLEYWYLWIPLFLGFLIGLFYLFR